MKQSRSQKNPYNLIQLNFKNVYKPAKLNV